VRCRTAFDVGVEAVFTGAVLGYKLKKRAGAAEDVKRRGGGEEAMGVKRRSGRRRDGEEDRGGWIACWRRRGGSSPTVHMGVEAVYVKKTAPMDQRRLGNTPRRVGGWASTGGG
jgi:hypothetical protein